MLPHTVSKWLSRLSLLTLILAIVGPHLCAVAGAEEIAVVTERNVAVPMRDGVILRANVFRPDDDNSYPVLVMRTPYGKRTGGMDRYVKAGYIVVSQDARGRFDSGGK